MRQKVYGIVCQKCHKEGTIEASGDLLEKMGILESVAQVCREAALRHMIDDRCAGPVVPKISASVEATAEMRAK